MDSVEFQRVTLEEFLNDTFKYMYLSGDNVVLDIDGIFLLYDEPWTCYQEGYRSFNGHDMEMDNEINVDSDEFMDNVKDIMESVKEGDTTVWISDYNYYILDTSTTQNDIEKYIYWNLNGGLNAFRGQDNDSEADEDEDVFNDSESDDLFDFERGGIIDNTPSDNREPEVPDGPCYVTSSVGIKMEIGTFFNRIERKGFRSDKPIILWFDFEEKLHDKLFYEHMAKDTCCHYDMTPAINYPYVYKDGKVVEIEKLLDSCLLLPENYKAESNTYITCEFPFGGFNERDAEYCHLLQEKLKMQVVVLLNPEEENSGFNEDEFVVFTASSNKKQHNDPAEETHHEEDEEEDEDENTEGNNSFENDGLFDFEKM